MWPYIPDHQYRILTIEGSGSGKTNPLLNLLNLIKNQSDIDKINLYAKYQYLINKREKVDLLKHFDYTIAFIKYSNDMQDVHENIEKIQSWKET